ncbi:MAG: hypothetical protein LUH48_06515 [Clostridiales bacterium]|nr:hypothetical protein [Clostridiales bacterium]
MKKKYIVPDLHFESFVLSQSVAAGCGKDGIGFVDSVTDLGYFLATTPSNNQNYTCTTVLGEDDYEIYCYWDGQSDNKLFLS